MISTKDMTIYEKKILIMTWEFVIRTIIEDEDIYLDWLENGVPDGMLPYRTFNTDLIDDDDWMLTDEGFNQIYKTFIRCIKNHNEEEA